MSFNSTFRFILNLLLQSLIEILRIRESPPRRNSSIWGNELPLLRNSAGYEGTLGLSS